MILNKKNLISTIIIFIIILFFIEQKLFSFYIPSIKNSSGDIVKFGDWTVVVDLAKCFQQGIDVFNNNKCDVTGRPHVYGTILLYLPFVSSFYELYIFAIPLLIVFFLILIANIFFKPKSFSDYTSMICIIFSTPFILAMERSNIEVMIFFFLILLALLTNSKFQKIIILLLSSIKFYPVTLVLFFLKEKVCVKFFKENLLFIMILLICFYLDKEQILNIYSKKNLINPSTVDNVGFLIFSFYGIPELAKSTILHLQIFIIKKNQIANFFYYISLVVLVLFILFQTFKNFFKNKLMLKNQQFNFNLEYFEDKLFILSIILILTIYFISMNYVYKEIYFLGLIPLLKKKINIEKNNLSKKIYNLIRIKFILLSFLWIIQLVFFKNSLYFKGLNILIKNLIDLYLVIILLKVFLSFLLQFFIINYSLIKKVIKE